MILIRLAIHKLFIAIAASPAPRKMPLIRNSSIMATLPPSIIRVKVEPSATTSGLAPMSDKISPANTMPKMLKISVINKEMMSDCAPA